MALGCENRQGRFDDAIEHLLGISPHCVKVYERKGRIVVGERFFVALQPARRVQPDRPVGPLLATGHVLHAVTLLNMGRLS